MCNETLEAGKDRNGERGSRLYGLGALHPEQMEDFDTGMMSKERLHICEANTMERSGDCRGYLEIGESGKCDASQKLSPALLGEI